MEFLPDDYVLGVWIVGNERRGNTTISVVKRGGKWLVRVRCRWYKDDKIFGSSDTKNFYTIHIPETETEENVISTLNEALDAMTPLFPGGGAINEVIMIQGDTEKAVFKLAQSKWMHVRRIPKPEGSDDNGKRRSKEGSREPKERV